MVWTEVHGAATCGDTERLSHALSALISVNTQEGIGVCERRERKREREREKETVCERQCGRESKKDFRLSDFRMVPNY